MLKKLAVAAAGYTGQRSGGMPWGTLLLSVGLVAALLLAFCAYRRGNAEGHDGQKPRLLMLAAHGQKPRAGAADMDEMPATSCSCSCSCSSSASVR